MGTRMIILSSDHGGFALKQDIKAHLDEQGVAYKDVGTYTEESCDYPDYALKGAREVLTDEANLGIFCCGTGIGISIAANKVRGIRAAACSDLFSATYTRKHNNANVLCLGGRVVGPGLALMMVDAFISTSFEGDRHQRRVDKIRNIEEENV
jgi:ribose 5-phosphate isomerase B